MCACVFVTHNGVGEIFTPTEPISPMVLLQATGGVRVNKGKKGPAGPPPDLVEVAFADEIGLEVLSRCHHD